MIIPSTRERCRRSVDEQAPRKSEGLSLSCNLRGDFFLHLLSPVPRLVD
jgi:hypothetical protein